MYLARKGSASEACSHQRDTALYTLVFLESDSDIAVMCSSLATAFHIFTNEA